MIPTTIDLVTCDELLLDLRQSFQDVIPEGVVAQMYRQGTAYHAVYVQDGRLIVKALGFAIPMVEVTDAVRESNPMAAYDCHTNAMDEMLDGVELQWFRASDGQHYAGFVQEDVIEMHPCHISYDRERVPA